MSVRFVPGSALTLGAGALFGLVSASATLGATAAFLVGRYLARNWVEKEIAGNAAFAAIGLGGVAGAIHPYPTQAEAVRKVGDLYARTRLTPFVKRLLLKWFA